MVSLTSLQQLGLPPQRLHLDLVQGCQMTKFDHINVPTSPIHTYHEDVSKSLFLYNALLITMRNQALLNHNTRNNLIHYQIEIIKKTSLLY